MRKCRVPGCERKHYGNGLCSLHYQRKKRGYPIDAPIRTMRKAPSDGKCTHPGCEKPYEGNGYCAMHRARLRLGIDMDKPSQFAQIGETRPDSYGYIRVKVRTGKGAGNWMFEHRHVMERHLGRPLYPDERIHHINGDRADNRLENLELWSHAHPAGQRVADKVQWCREFLSRYDGVTLT